MKKGDTGHREPPPPFQSKCAQQLVLGSLGPPIGIPAPQLVVPDAAHPGRQAGEMAGSVPGKGPFQRLGQQEGPPGIHSKTLLEGLRIHLAEPFFGLQVGSVQQTRRTDHQPKGRKLLPGDLAQALQADGIRQIHRQICLPSPGRPQPQGRSMDGESLQESLPNASPAHHQGMTLPGLPGTGGVVTVRHRRSGGLSHDGKRATKERGILRITLLGLGAWGSTLADLWRAQGHELITWTRRTGGSPKDSLAGSDLVVSAVAMAGVPALASQLAPSWPEGLPLLSCSKGIDPVQLCSASQLWERQLPGAAMAALSGPNLATELARGLPAASVIASTDRTLAQRLQSELRTPHLRLYTNQDPLGTEVAGALKNVMAIAAGISDGLGLGSNAKASLLTRGLAETGLVLKALGGQPSTLYGLAGLGDLLATANSPLSRNYRFGLLLAQGASEDSAREDIGATVEGPATARAALKLADREGWSLPICRQVVQLLEGQLTAPAAVQALMDREPRQEELQW